MKKINIISKNFFTLLEILIAISLLTILVSLVSIKTTEAINKYRFDSNIKKISSYVEFSKKIAISHKADVILTFNQKKSDTTLKISSYEDTPIFNNMKNIEEKFKNLNFSFDKTIIKNLTITFTSTGYYFPKGEIAFADKYIKYPKIINL
jgi:Tfp pilus assembly protein FimT